MTGGVTVRAFRPADGAALLGLHRACLAHYACEPAPAEVEAELLRELAAPDGTHADITWQDGRAEGFTFSVRVPAGPGFALYLKELFVTDAARGAGAGRALMQALAELAQYMGARRLQWETGDNAARAFYAGLGASPDGKTHYSVDAADLRSFAVR